MFHFRWNSFFKKKNMKNEENCEIIKYLNINIKTCKQKD